MFLRNCKMGYFVFIIGIGKFAKGHVAVGFQCGNAINEMFNYDAQKCVSFSVINADLDYSVGNIICNVYAIEVFFLKIYKKDAYT